ncbi:MAG: acyltransferase [Myxococcaceae bacterium]
MNVRLFAAQAVVGRLPPFVASRVRSQALRAAGVKLGETSVFWDFPSFHGTAAGLERLSIGEFCGFNTGCAFDLDEALTIEDHVSVGHDVLFLTRGWELGDSSRRAARRISAPVRICKGAWIGARATICPGVTIGTGAVIGASAVIEKDVPAQTLVMGTQRISLAKWRA